jgi:large subunit ribosomal protein L22
LPTWGYSYAAQGEKEAMASGRDLRVSFKEMVELLREIRGKKLSEAYNILDEVIALRRAIPFKRYNGGVPHRKGISGAGRYPVKAAKLLKKILKSAEHNAMNKDLDPDNLYVKHAAAQMGMKLRRFFPRAYGRASPKIEQMVHVEIVLEEREESEE